MVFVARLDGEGCAIEEDALRGIIQGDKDPVAGGDLFLVLDAAEFVTGVIAHDLVTIHPDISIYQRRVQEGGILRHGHIGDHDLVSLGGLDFFVLTEEELAGGDLYPAIGVDPGVEGR